VGSLSPPHFGAALRPVPFRGRAHGLGPDHDEPCPCGSGQPCRRCHWDRTAQRWRLPNYQPPHTGERSGIGHPGCYANVSTDCDGKQSSEHWLSKAILTAHSEEKLVAIGELPFQQPGDVDKYTPKSLGANILCERHNSGLSRLDTAALALITALDSFYLDQAGPSGDYTNEFDLFSGPEVERWLLKMVWGASTRQNPRFEARFAAASLPITSSEIPSCRSAGDYTSLEVGAAGGWIPSTR